MNDRSAIRAQPSARGRQAVSDGNNRRSEMSLYPPGRKDSPSAMPAGSSSRRAGVFCPGFTDQLRQYHDAKRMQIALALVDDKFGRIMPSDERGIAAVDAVNRVINTLPMRIWTVVDIKRHMRKASLHTVRCALAYLVLEGDAVAHVASARYGGLITYCHPDYLEEGVH